MQRLNDMSTSELVVLACNYATSITEIGIYSELVKELTTRLSANTSAAIYAKQKYDEMAVENAGLKDENQYIRMRFKESDLLFGKLMLTMRTAVIEMEHGEGHKAGMDWIFNLLAGPGEFAPESETDAQAYFNQQAEIIDIEHSKCIEFFTKRNESIRVAALSKGAAV